MLAQVQPTHQLFAHLGASFGFCFHEGSPKDLGLMGAKHFQVEKLGQMQKLARWLSG